MENISKHITFDEATRSETATKLSIENIPNDEQIDNMKYVAENVFEKVRNHFGVPISVNSFFRSRALNKAVGGAHTSQHLTGQAIDISAFKSTGITNKQIFDFIKDNCEHDQVLWEYGTEYEPEWVHVSLKKYGNRNQKLRVTRHGTTVIK